MSTSPQLVVLCVLITILLSITGGTIAQEQCGSQAGGALCPGGMCCSQWGFCGTTDAYCGTGCQSQCPAPEPPPPAPAPPAGSCPCPQGQCCSKWGFCGDSDAYCGPDCQSQCPGPNPSPPPHTLTLLELLINSTLFEKLLLHRNDQSCQSRGFYTYNAFITAAKSFPRFGAIGDFETRKREIAAFLAQTSHQTTGILRPSTVPDGPYTWGYCIIEQLPPRSSYCTPITTFQCAPGKQYYGRGPMQFTNNNFYGRAGQALGYDLINDPDALSNDAVLSFKSALWFWMSIHPPRPSCHNVMTGRYQPGQHDLDNGRLPGYGTTTNVINGMSECGSRPQGSDPREESRIGFFKRYCDVFGVSYGDNLYCNNMTPYPSLRLESM